MDEYIKREDVIKVICVGCNEEFSEEPCEPDCCAIRQAIKNIPLVDVLPKTEVAREVTEEFKELVKQHLLSLGIYPVFVKNAMEYAESKLKKKYMEERE